MGKNWTEIEDKKLLELVEAGLTTEEIAKILNRTYKSVHHRRVKLLSNKNGIIKNDFSTPKGFAEVNIQLIRDLRDKILNLPRKEYGQKRHKLFKSGDTLVIHFTDWHIGRIVRDEEGNELYNTQIFKARIDKLLEEIIFLVDEYVKKGTPIKDAVIISTGDILDGMGIYSTQETQSELSPPFQVMMAVETIKNFILSLTKRKLTVRFYGVRGNHGEIRGAGGRQKDPNANWDMQLYLILDFWSRSIKSEKIQIYYSELDYLNFEIQGWKYHIRHIAPQQSETSAGKARFLGWARKHKCDVLVYGHYHHYAITDRSGVTVIRGGSMTGADEYSEQLAEESEPIQVIWGCSQKRPVTFMYAIDLGGRKKR